MKNEDSFEQQKMAHVAESALMGAVLLAPEMIDRLHLDGNHFLDMHKGRAFDLLRDMREAGQAVDGVAFALETKRIKCSTVTLFEALGGAAEIAKWADSSVPAQAPYYAEQVTKWYQVRHVQAKLADQLHALNQIDADPQAILSRLEAILQSSVRFKSDNERNFRDMSAEALESALVEITHESVVPFGYADLDARMGGLYPGEMTTIGARPSVGKSALGFGIALNAAKAGKRVTFLSCEMTLQQLGHRCLSIETHIPVNKIRNGYLTPEEKHRLRQAVEKVLPVTGRAWVAARPTVQSIRARCRIEKAGNGLDLLVIDYLGLLKPVTRGKPYEQVSELTADLKALATELEIPVLVMCQLNRQAGDAKPRLEHLRDSGSIEQDSNNVLFIERKRGEEAAEIIIAKQRQGEVQAFEMRFNSDRCCFEDVDPPNEEHFANEDFPN